MVFRCGNHSSGRKVRYANNPARETRPSIKFPTAAGVATVAADQEKARACYLVSCKEAAKLSAAIKLLPPCDPSCSFAADKGKAKVVDGDKITGYLLYAYARGTIRFCIFEPDRRFPNLRKELELD
ncbi:hypothetical protein M569_00177 [Genlisea aurea]|uniref:Uncharacterized protein n=1 Tax=Genlisea aurea TaxID=192259 RepID=S8EF02_9LAMI|nr:hypothetical protein M569_00177 [Genlisea aurea]